MGSLNRRWIFREGRSLHSEKEREREGSVSLVLTAGDFDACDAFRFFPSIEQIQPYRRSWFVRLHFAGPVVSICFLPHIRTESSMHTPDLIKLLQDIPSNEPHTKSNWVPKTVQNPSSKMKHRICLQTKCSKLDASWAGKNPVEHKKRRSGSWWSNPKRAQFHCLLRTERNSTGTSEFKC